MCTLYGWRINKRRYGGDWHKVFKQVTQRENLPKELMQEFREYCLRIHLKNASNTAYWKEIFEHYGINTNAADIFSEYKKIPVINKRNVQKNVESFLNPYYHGNTYQTKTSGSTGAGLSFPMTVLAEQVQWATWWRYRLWHNINPDQWCGYFGGRAIVPSTQKYPPFYRINKSGKQVMFSSYHLNSETVSHYLEVIRKKEIKWLHGYSSQLALLAHLAHEKSLEVPKIDIITLGAEGVSQKTKELLKEVFNCPVREHYGLAEGVANISECGHGNFHIDEDFSMVELMPVYKGSNKYRIIGGNWHNSYFVLLRYDTGDIATLDDRICLCGKPGRIVSQIDGRSEDYIVLKDGTRVGSLNQIFKVISEAREAQIYQRIAGYVTVRIVKGGNYDKKSEEALTKKFHEFFGPKLEFKIEYWDELPRTTAGKLRMVVSEL